MRAQPQFLAGDRPIDDRNCTPVRSLHHPAQGLALRHCGEDLGAILVNIDIEAASYFSIVDDIEERASQSDDVARQPIHLDETVIADNQPPGCIENDDTLRHIVEGHDEQMAASAPLAPPPGTPQRIQKQERNAHRQEDNDGKPPVLFEHRNNAGRLPQSLNPKTGSIYESLTVLRSTQRVQQGGALSLAAGLGGAAKTP